MEVEKNFQGVILCSLDQERNLEETINKLLDLKTSLVYKGLTCSPLELKNKYYRATIHLIDGEQLASRDAESATPILENCHAIILLCNGQKITTAQLDEKVKQFASVGGEPRILLYSGIDEDCSPYKSLRDWSIKNSYDLIDVCDETAENQLVDSLSAYKWIYRSSEESKVEEKPQQLNDEMLKKLADFDSLLGKLGAYRDRPELRGNPDDKNIAEIAEILSGLLGDDVDNFLDNEEPVNNNNQSKS